jgi:hypothetical protein
VVVDSAATNAAIARFQGFQCIIIALGLPAKVMKMLRQMCSNENLRDYIHSNRLLSEPDGDSIRTRDEAVRYLLDTDIVDRGQVATELAVQINYLALYWLTAHEIGHFALGHKPIHTTYFMDETNADPSLLSQRRAFEWDADTFALLGTLYLTLTDFKDSRLMSGLLTDPSTSLRVVAIAAYCIFTVMDASSPQDKPPHERTHPRPLVRMGLVTFKATAMMQMLRWMWLEEGMESMRQTNRAFEVALFELAGGVMEAPLAERLTDELGGEFDELHELFQAISPALDRSRLKGLAWAEFLK